MSQIPIESLRNFNIQPVDDHICTGCVCNGFSVKVCALVNVVMGKDCAKDKIIFTPKQKKESNE